MDIKLSDGDLFPRGVAKVSKLTPCPVCKNSFMDNYPPRYPVWSDVKQTLVCRNCFDLIPPNQDRE